MKNHPLVSYEYAIFATRLTAVSKSMAVLRPFLRQLATEGKQKGRQIVAKVSAERNHVGAFHSVGSSLHSRGVSDWWPCATRTRLMGCTHSRGVSGWLHVRPELDLWVALTPRGCQVGYMCHQNSTYGLHALPGGVRLVAMEHTGCHQMVF
jgi:hypothetical protein